MTDQLLLNHELRLAKFSSNVAQPSPRRMRPGQKEGWDKSIFLQLS